MKISGKYSAILFFTSLISSLSIASPEPYYVVHDTDGLDRETHYDHGSITSVTTASTSARQFSLYIFRNNFDSNCTYANIFDMDTGMRIADGPITPADVQTSTLMVNLDFPDDILSMNKSVNLACVDSNGTGFTVEHKVPGAPQVEWTSSLTPTGAWIPAPGCERAHCHPGFGYFESLHYNASINVNNHTDEGFCRIVYERGAPIPLFHGKYERRDFHNDYFTTDLEIENYEPPVILQRIACENSGGITHAIQVWEVVDNEVRLVENTTFIQ